MIKTLQQIQKLEKEKMLITFNGVYIEKNPLTSDWFIFAKTLTGEDASIYGTLSEMKKCAKFANKSGKITQTSFYELIKENN